MNRHVIVAGLGFGDEGKGALVDWLCRPFAGAEPIDAVVRFNGGAQAGHNVVLPDGRHHTFSQFGSGTLRGVPTHLSHFMMVEPLSLATEAAHLASLGVPDPFGLISADRRSLLTTPFHAAANQAREAARGSAAHGTCGRGIGETVVYARSAGADAPLVGDCDDAPTLRRKLTRLRDAYAAEFGAPLAGLDLEELLDTYQAFAGIVRLTDEHYLSDLLATGRVVFEGAQGVLLDAYHGFHPHTTWSVTTFTNAQTLLYEAGIGRDDALKIGIMRAYTTRHGAGPFPTEDAAMSPALPEVHNDSAGLQGAWRVGHLDLVLARYAAEVARPDVIALTHLDRVIAPGLQVARAYEVGDEHLERIEPGSGFDRPYQESLTRLVLGARPVLSPLEGSVEEAVAQACATPVMFTASGPTAADYHALVAA